MKLDFKLLKPAAAIKFFERKGIHIGFDWRDTAKQLHDISFTAAKFMETSVLLDLKTEIQKAMQAGVAFESFKKTLIPILSKKGWWGEREVVDEQTGEVKKVKFTPQRLKNIYNTNLQTSFGEGRWQEIQDTKQDFPYLQYVGCNSAEPRTNHCSWNGTVLPVDDPWWLNHCPEPPKEWGCKCFTIQLTKSQAAKKGISPQAPKETFVEWKNKRTGKTMKVPQGVNPAFYREPGLENWKASLEQSLKDQLAQLDKLK